MKVTKYILPSSPITKLILSPQQQQSLIQPQLIDLEDYGTIRDPTIQSKQNLSNYWKSETLKQPDSEIKIRIQQQVPDEEEFQKYLKKDVVKFSYLYDIEKDYELSKWILLPSSQIFQISQVLVIINFYLLLFYLPLQITFQLVKLNGLFIILVLLNAIFKLNSSYAMDGELIISQRSIIKHYIQNRLIEDIIKLFSVGMQLFIPDLDWIAFLIIMLIHFPEFRTNFKKCQIKFHLFSPQFQIFKLSLQFIAVVHVLVCVWHSQNIQILQNGQNSYLQALYVTIGILTLNNNYVPQNDGELLLFCLTAVIAIIFFCYVLIRLSQIIGKDTQLIEAHNFIQENGVNDNFNLTEQILSSNQRIPIKLMKQIRLNERMHILGEYFNKYSPFTIRKLVELCEVVKCEPNQVILDESTKDDCSVYFILEGIFKVCNTNGTRLGTLSRKKESVQTFGEISFFTGQNRTASIVSECNGRLLKLSRECFQKEMNAIDKQIFFSTRDEIVFQQKLPKTCLCCQSNSHYILKCPVLTYQPEIKDQNCNDLQERKPMKRSLYKDQRAWEFVTVSGMLQQDLKEIYEESKEINTLPPIEGQQGVEKNQVRIIATEQGSPKKSSRIIQRSYKNIQSSFNTFLNLGESDRTIQSPKQLLDGFEKLFHFDQFFPQQNYEVTIQKSNQSRNIFQERDFEQEEQEQDVVIK